MKKLYNGNTCFSTKIHQIFFGGCRFPSFPSSKHPGRGFPAPSLVSFNAVLSASEKGRIRIHVSYILCTYNLQSYRYNMKWYEFMFFFIRTTWDVHKWMCNYCNIIIYVCILCLQFSQLEELLFRSTDDFVMVIMSPWRERPYLCKTTEIRYKYLLTGGGEVHVKGWRESGRMQITDKTIPSPWFRKPKEIHGGSNSVIKSRSSKCWASKSGFHGLLIIFHCI